ncbi:MAG TPA: hypothetical protein DEA78_13215, partial [Cyanobacteria bacterium UBA11159]|nr:hypothetical protein [Cyanobacteria bacterium UBA11367]HBR74638.1 hypothetical protein [Cyanobacteria bacterium UBA11159]HBS71313.1 hypothetical protein [Cyanobacteria bacterium UBA11153]
LNAQQLSFARLRHRNSAIIEATGWVKDESDKVTLVATIPNLTMSAAQAKLPNCLLKGSRE